MNEENQRQTRIINPHLLTNKDIKRRVEARQFLADSCKIAETLSPRNKIMFLLHYDHGYTNGEIAELCKCDVSVVNNKMRRITKEINKKREMLTNNKGTIGEEEG